MSLHSDIFILILSEPVYALIPSWCLLSEELAFYTNFIGVLQARQVEEFEDTERVIRIRKSKKVRLISYMYI
jgi:hypothetical protein